MKSLIWIGITIGGLIGGGIGYFLDGGNSLGLWSLLLTTVGSLAGIWAAVKFG
jgi:hypothetical protein